MSNYKLVVVSDNTDKTLVRYIKKGDKHWQNLYLDESDVDVVIDTILERLKDDPTRNSN